MVAKGPSCAGPHGMGQQAQQVGYQSERRQNLNLLSLEKPPNQLLFFAQVFHQKHEGKQKITSVNRNKSKLKSFSTEKEDRKPSSPQKSNSKTSNYLIENKHF